MCDHTEFTARVGVARIERTTPGGGMAFAAEVRIHCAACGRAFQFLGLQPGVDMQGARMSVDGLEARLAICPQGEVPSPLDNIAVNFNAVPNERKH